MKKSLQLLCCQYAKKREAELNNVDGRKRKRKKSAKLREQDDDFGTEEEHREDVPIIAEKTKLRKKILWIEAQFESAKTMAQQVTMALQSTDSSENLSAEENSVVSSISIPSPSISTPEESTLTNNYDKDLTSCIPSPLPSSKSTYDRRTPENESLSQTSHKTNYCSTPFNSPTLMGNSPTYITLTTPKPRQSNLDHDRTVSTPFITTSAPVSRITSARQLHFQPDISTGSAEEQSLSSEINNAICLSYNCTQWQADPGDDADPAPPKCECEKLREEDSRLKAKLEGFYNYRPFVCYFLVPEAPAAAVMYLESLRHVQMTKLYQ